MFKSLPVTELREDVAGTPSMLIAAFVFTVAVLGLGTASLPS
jgi:hypothetical protein